jgi:two-component system, response regulator YesN
MYRMLIVDDEAIITDGLYEVFENLQHLELDLYKAYSGPEALQLCQRMRPDIVLSDIRMPEMDGLQLLERIRGMWPKCRVIFLTGHNEFSYIYTAIQYDSVGYLLKTEGYDRIIQVVEQTLADLDSELKAEALLEQAEVRLGAARELLQRDYLYGIVKGLHHKEDISRKQFEELDIPLDAGKPVLMMLGRLNSLPGGLSYSEKSHLLFSIRLIAEQYLSARARLAHVVVDNTDLVWLIQEQDEPDPQAGLEGGRQALRMFVTGNVELIQAACRESVGALISFALDDSPVQLDQVGERFSMLNMLVNYRIGQGSGMLLLDKHILERELQRPAQHPREMKHMRQSLLDRLADSLEHGHRDEFGRILSELTEGKNGTDMQHIPGQELYFSVALIYLSYLNRWNLVERAANAELNRLMQPGSHSSWTDAVQYLASVGTMLFDLQHVEQERRAQTIISAVQRHVQQHLDNPDELSLVRLAELVYFNPSYLSRLFKQETGLNLSDYINSSRMNKAMELLRSPDMKIQEVAEQVGYNSSANFTRSFRRYTQKTPQEYRAELGAGL